MDYIKRSNLLEIGMVKIDEQQYSSSTTVYLFTRSCNVR